jgi:hypothetical protein
MMGKRVILLAVVFLLAGCGFRATSGAVPEYTKKTRLVALMPVNDQANDKTAALMLREKMLEELYYKGYPKIPLGLIDAQLFKLDQGNSSPQAVGALLKVDAIMYCTLGQSSATQLFLYTPTVISAVCELKSAQTGEIFWQAHYDVVERNFGYSRYESHRKAVQAYEAAIQKVVNKFMETFPDGPDLS